MKFYFGFGANRSAEMIRAITGRSAIGVPAQIMHFQLCTESLRNIPLRARRILAKKWGEDFVSYGIVPKREQQVRGHLWLLTDRQRECVRQWELVGAWSNEWICWITSPKKPETRRHRLERACAELAEGKRRPCCFAGCNHR